MGVIDCLCVFCFDFFCDMDYWNPRQIKRGVKLQHSANAENYRRPRFTNVKKIKVLNGEM